MFDKTDFPGDRILCSYLRLGSIKHATFQIFIRYRTSFLATQISPRDNSAKQQSVKFSQSVVANFSPILRFIRKQITEDVV